MSVRRALVLGYGNPGRQDDGLGPALVAALEAKGLDGVTLDADYQLNIEDGLTASRHDVVLFVDASVNGPEPYALRRLAPASEITFTTHSVSPESVLAVCDEHFGANPDGYVLGIRGYGFEFEEGLTPQAQQNLQAAVAFVQSWLQDQEGATG